MIWRGGKVILKIDGGGSITNELSVNGLNLYRGNKQLKTDLNFRLAPGECCWLCGANGSGKTSLLRLIAGFAPVIEGTIIYTRVADKSDISNYCHFINEQNGIKPFLTPQQWLQLYAKLLSVTNSVGDAGGQWSTKAWCADKALDHLGLARQRYMACKQLSQGQKKRLGLALLLVCPRPIWLLDEPFNSLDKTGSDLLSAMINQHIRDNGMVIIACHGRPGLAITTTVNLEPQAGQP